MKWLAAILGNLFGDLPQVEVAAVPIIEINEVMQGQETRFIQYIFHGPDERFGSKTYQVYGWTAASKCTLYEIEGREGRECAITWMECDRLRVVVGEALWVTRHEGDVEVGERQLISEEKRLGLWNK